MLYPRRKREAFPRKQEYHEISSMIPPVWRTEPKGLVQRSRNDVKL